MFIIFKIGNLVDILEQIHANLLTIDTNLFYDIIEKDYFCKLHGEVILIGARFQVAHYRGAYAERRNQEAGKDEVCRFSWLWIHQ